MTIAYWCLLVAALMPYLFTGVAKSAPGYDNRRPRAWLEEREGVHERAHAAQLNSFEAFPPFAAAVLVAHLTGGAEQGTIDALALAWLLLRAGYGAAYLGDQHLLRSSLWVAAMAVVIALFVVAA
ncbi:MAG: MAPEG family protein [Pseudomonadales bacterium]|nr:MAPEG family protein [Pseudomonadales bacterium]